MTYTWTDDAMKSGTTCDVDKANDNLMHLKYDQGGKVSYSVSSGNINANGYPDLINKVSDTEVSFKVGDTYPNMIITYADGSLETVTSINNKTGLSSDSVYSFIKEKGASDVLTALEEYNIVPIMTSNSQGGFVASASNELYPAYQAFNRSNADNWVSSATAATLQIQLPAARAVNSYEIISNASPPTSWTFEGSNNGSSWTTLETQSNITDWNVEAPFTPKRYPISNTTNYLYYRLNISASSQSNLGIHQFNLYSGNKIESYVFPSSPSEGQYCYNLSNNKTYKYSSSSWVETQFVKLGKAEKASGTLGTPVSFASNGFFIGSTGLESEVGCDYFTQTLSSGKKLYKRGF